MNKKINFKEIEIATIDGKKQKVDFSKEIAKGIYFATKDLGVVETARTLYKEGECECSDKFIGEVKQFVERSYGTVVGEAINKVIG